jgi:hypothetical protein
MAGGHGGASSSLKPTNNQPVEALVPAIRDVLVRSLQKRHNSSGTSGAGQVVRKPPKRRAGAQLRRESDNESEAPADGDSPDEGVADDGDAPV